MINTQIPIIGSGGPISESATGPGGKAADYSIEHRIF